MKLKKILILLFGLKLMIMGACVSILLVNNFVVQAGWFSTIQSEANVRSALAAGAPVDELNDDGQTPLMVAASQGDLAMVRLLVENGARVNAQVADNEAININWRGFTPLHFACENDLEDFKEIIAYLVNQGAHVKAKSSLGDTPLHKAMEIDNLNDRLDVFKLLISKGADINAQNNDGATVAHLAVQHDDAEWLEMLLVNFPQINVRLKDNQGYAPIDLQGILNDKLGNVFKKFNLR